MTDTTAVDPEQTIDGLVVEKPDEGESVRDSIAAAMKEAAGEDDAADEAEVAEAADEADENADKSATDESEAEAQADKQADEQADEQADDEADDEPEPITAPASWNEHDREVFAKLDRETQEVIARRESERDEGVNKRLEETKALRDVVSKYDQYLKQLNTTPEAAFDWLMAAEYQLRTGTPQQKQAALLKVAQDYGISLSQYGQAEPGAVEDDYDVSPQVAQLQQEIAELKGSLESRQRAEQTSQMAQAEQKIVAFREAKTEAGQPAHPFFGDVESDMVALAHADRAAGKEPEIADLYERACWQNPTIRQKMQEAAQAESAKKAVADKAKRAAQAKKAAKTVSSRSSGAAGGNEPPKDESVRDSIRAAMREAGAA